jgi:hypothetical protein
MITRQQTRLLSDPINVPPPTAGFDPSIHLRRCAARAHIVVVLIGDSLMTPNTNPSNSSLECLAGVLEARIRAQNPEKTFTFHNLAIGGSTWTNANPATVLNTTGLTLPSWAGAGTLPWLDYAEALNPDWIIANWGMNDRQNVVIPVYRAVLAAISLFPTDPDVTLLTTMVPNRISTDADIGGAAAQNGRIAFQHFVRTAGAVDGMGVIDLGRAQMRAVQGVDTAVTSTARNATSQSITTPFVDTVPSQQDLRISIPYTAAVGYWSKVLRIDTGAVLVNSASFVEITNNGGFLQVTWAINDDPSGRYQVDLSAVPTPTSGSFTLDLILKGGAGIVTHTDAAGVVSILSSRLVKRFGGEMFANVRWTDGTVMTFTGVFIWRGSWVRCAPQLSDERMWGSEAISDAIEAGNNKNHPTSLGAAVVYNGLIEITDFRIPAISRLGQKVGIGEPDPNGYLHINEDGGATILPNALANGLVVQHTDTVGASLLTNSATGVARLLLGTAALPDDGGLTYNAGTRRAELRAAQQVMMTILAPAANRDTSMWLVENVSGTLTVRPVSAAAGTTADVGKRCLQI